MVGRDLEKLVILARPQDRAMDVIQKLARSGTAFFGIAVVTDEQRRILGVLNDGDILRLLAKGVDFSQCIERVMTPNPVKVASNMTHEEIIDDVQMQLHKRNVRREAVRYVLVVDDNDVFVNVLRFSDLLSLYKRFGEKVAIYGQGFIGLTLAAVLSNRGHKVFGIDVEENLIRDLNRGQVHVHEPRLADMVRTSLGNGSLSFKMPAQDFDANIYIVAVGTPASDDGGVDLQAFELACSHIGQRLRRGDIVMMRSTVPVGITRGVARPILEQESGYKAGQDFYLAFTPERTAQGVAVRELRKLPQVVGGLTPVCAQKAATFWATLTDSVVNVPSLESAEMIKLINNGFRDLSFAFSNSVAMLCDRYNINAFHLINAANEGYLRDPIPLPSPGVGGYCLTKDPYLFAGIGPDMGHARLATSGRKINDQAAEYPVQALHRYAQRLGIYLHAMKILVIGLAYKGWPETNDLRGASSLRVVSALKALNCKVLGWDAVLSVESIAALGIQPIEISEAEDMVDAVFILNNHPYNIQNGFFSNAKNRKIFIFDGWAMLDARDMEQHPNITYATMGYMTPAKE